MCGELLGVAPLAERELFIRWSAVAFGLVAALLLLSALAASAQRRGDRPGAPTIAGVSLFGAATLVAVAWPHGPTAAPAQAVMTIDVLAPILSYGAALAVPVLASVLAWCKLRGPRPLRGAQIGAWATLLIVLPLIMAATYLTVTPICLG